MLVPDFERALRGAWRGLKVYSPLRGVPILIQRIHLLSYLFRLNTLKGTSNAPAVDLLRLNNL